MRGKKFSAALTAMLAILAASLLATGRLAVAQQETIVHSFGAGEDGANPQARLISDAAGNLYGTTFYGGNVPSCYRPGIGCGTVFELTPTASGWAEKILYDFNSNGKDGIFPGAGLILDAYGNLYSTTYAGGAYGGGTVFELTPSADGTWAEKILHNFGGNSKDGTASQAALTLDAAGNLYGTTYSGGAYGYGMVFELTPTVSGAWTEKILHNFDNNGKDGIFPYAGLTIDASGNLYGTTYTGGAGAQGGGTVFELTPRPGGEWTEKILHNFGASSKDGSASLATLVFDAARNLYGTTGGGVYSAGTVFELTPTAGGGWAEKILHSFNNNGMDGTVPYFGVVLDAVGNLYGTTYSGGIHGAGTVFELTPTAGGGWSEKILHSFGAIATDGATPFASVIVAADGNLYGTTEDGGFYGHGTVFEITP